MFGTSSVSSEREVFTVWMKSLVLNGNGCTVFDKNGDIVYRIDNYECKDSSEVLLMDLRGSVLFTIVKKKFRLFGCWEGYRSTNSMSQNDKQWFRVRKVCKFPKRISPCEVTVKLDEKESTVYYRMERLGRNSACRIIDNTGRVVAEMRKKQTDSGVALGDDVSTLVVEPHVDHSLIMGLVVVYGLINHTV
ncbi:hypothetical protein ACHQM5_029631 [Ranunculus cassubicifolius]